MTDPYTKAGPLCNNGTVTKNNPMWHGTDYACTGSAHYAGEHIYCTDRSHHVDPSTWYPLKRYRPRLEAGTAYMPQGPEGQDIIVVTYSENLEAQNVGKVFIYRDKWESYADGWMLD